MFEQVRRAHSRIEELNAIIAEGGFDWRPEGVSSGDVGDPTANSVIASIEALAKERAELQSLFAIVGDCLRIVAGVRAGLGERYADVLELYYIDAKPWVDVACELQITEHWARCLRNVAIEWADSVGLAHVFAGKGFAT